MSAVPKSQEPILLREDRDGVCTLTMNRPQQLNLLTAEMLTALQDAFDSIKNDKTVRVIVLAGAGKGFCAGHDLREIGGQGVAQVIVVNREDGMLEGGLDLRAPDGGAASY